MTKEQEYEQVLLRIVDRWEREDNAKGNHGFDERRSPLAWAMWSDAKEVLAKHRVGEVA